MSCNIILCVKNNDIRDTLENAILQSNDFHISRKVQTFSECLPTSETGADLMILQYTEYVYQIQDLLYDLDCMNTISLFIIFKVNRNSEILYTTSNQDHFPQVKAAAQLFESVLSGTYKCRFSYFRHTYWENNALEYYPDYTLRNFAIMEILRGCSENELTVYKNLYNLDFKEKGYYLFFSEMQYTEYRGHMINKDVYNFVGEMLKNECREILSSYNGGEIIDITINFQCIIINDINIKSETKKSELRDEMIRKLIKVNNCKTANRYLSKRYEKLKDLRGAYDWYHAEKARVFFQRDIDIIRESFVMDRKQLDMDQVLVVLRKVTDILNYDLSNPVLTDLIRYLYFEVLKPSFNFTLFYYCTAAICSGISRVQGSLDDSLIRENLDPYLLQFSSIEQQYESILSRIRTLQEKYATKRKIKSSLVLKAMNYIAENYNRAITVSDIAKTLYVSKACLTQAFKSQLNVTVIQYLTTVRIEVAQKLLLETDDMIYNIAEKVGFSDSRYFCKTFKKLTGYSPREYRKRKVRSY